MSNIKQVIVMRTDLNMRKGKMIAQGSHASMIFLTEEIRRVMAVNDSVHCTDPDCCGDSLIDLDFSEAEREWINGSFTKICVGVNSEDELLEIEARAKFAGLLVHIVTDKGLTEFHGTPTKTCLAIGPAVSEDIDKITGHLKLL